MSLNMSILNCYPFLGIVWTMMTIAYFLWPEHYFTKKSEYLKFFLLSVSVYWFLVTSVHVAYREISGVLFLMGLIPFLAISHLIYPFKECKRNKHFTFFSIGISVFMFFTILIAWLLVAISDM